MLNSSRNIVLACALSGLAGYADGIGYLYLGGLFVSFMSGNSTRMGVSLADGHFQAAAEALGLIVLFVVGAACGSLIVLGRSRYSQSWVLLMEAMLLALAALSYFFDFDRVAIAAIVLAMGLENAVFQIDGGSGLGLTYVTGALVKIGQLMAAALTGGNAFGLGAEPVAVGGPGRRLRHRRAGLSLDQSRCDLVCGGRRARAERMGRTCCEPQPLTARAACPIGQR